jgi:hypothetical protein
VTRFYFVKNSSTHFWQSGPRWGKEQSMSTKNNSLKRYRAEKGAVIDNQTGTVWHSGWQEWEAAAIAVAYNTGDYSKLIMRPGMYIVGVRP